MTASRGGILVLATILLCAGSARAQPETVTVRPADTAEALENPGMGWVFHHFDNSLRQYGPPLGPDYAGEGFPGLTVAYLRLAWAYLEPEDGIFDWSPVDTVAQRYIRAGRKIAFRFTCFESGETYATPRWLKEAGVKGRWFLYGKGVVPEGTPRATWEPDYDDPLFLEKLDRFLAAAAARYDGSPHVAFVDIGSIGIWGEGNPCTRAYALDTYKTHIDLHFKHFKKTLLVGMDDWRPRPVLRTTGTHSTAFAVRLSDDLRGRDLHVRVGLWLPGQAGSHLPENRLLPAHARDDRRVEIGRLRIDEEGRMSCTLVALSEAVPEGVDFLVRPTGFRVAGSTGIVELRWSVPEDLPEGTRAFCHVGDDEVDIRQNSSMGTGRNDALDYVRELGGTMRDDSIIYRRGFTYQSDWMARDFWGDRPVVLESGHYWSNDWSDGADQHYFDAIEAYHGSYISIHGPPDRIWSDHSEIIRQMNRRIGYRLQLVEAGWPSEVVAGQPFEIRSSWRNAGVAPCYPGGTPAFALKSPRGTIHAVLTVPDMQMRDLDVGPPGEAPTVKSSATFRLPPDLPGGIYEVHVSVGDAQGTPAIALPLPDGDGDRRYRIGHLRTRVDADYRLSWGALTRHGDTWRLPITVETLKPLPPDTRPFVHLDLDAKIVKGLAARFDEGEEALLSPGTHAGYIAMTWPEDVRAAALEACMGLWVFQGDRLLPETGGEDRRVPLGTLRSKAGGELTLKPVDDGE